METLKPTHTSPQLALFRGETLPAPIRSEAPAASSPIPSEMLDLFQAMTGWVTEFRESRSSQRKREPLLKRHVATDSRNQLKLEIPPPEGVFSIVDMSTSWPAKRPTAHRAKCDRFIQLFNELVAKSQTLEQELRRYQSVLTNTENDADVEGELCDNFIPRYPYQTISEREGDFDLLIESMVSQDCQRGNEPMQGNKTQSRRGAQTVELSEQANHWQIGGRRGFFGNRYVDWTVRADQRIELIVGRIESLDRQDDPQFNREWKSRLTLNPATNRFWFSVDPCEMFWQLDHATQQFSRISRLDKVNELNSQQSIIVTTADVRLDELTPNLTDFDQQQIAFSNADELASVIQDWMGTEEPILVLMRH